MVISPSSEVIFLDVPIEIDNKNQLTFQNANAQFQYFRNLTPQKVYDNISYIRKDEYLRINDNFDNLIKYNYCMYQNEDYSGKWYYAFITRIEYLNDNMSKVYITTDVWQTYQFDITFYKSFIDREHLSVSDDVPGANLIPESLETGEFIENESTSISGLGICYVIAFGKDPYETLGEGSSGGGLNGCSPNYFASGIWYYVGNYYRVLEEIKRISDKGFPDDIITVFSIPSIAVYGVGGYSLSQLDNPLFTWGTWLTGTPSFEGRNIGLGGIGASTSLDGYIPRNQKLKTYPYTYLGFTPSNGGQEIIRYENFNSNPQFKMICEINPNPSIYFVPKNYKGITDDNVSEALLVNGYPQISYHTDFFSGWIAQNTKLVNLNREKIDLDYNVSVAQNALNYASQTANNFGSILSGNVVGGSVGAGISAGQAILNAYSGAENYDLAIGNQMAQIEKQSMLPNKAVTGGTNATLIQYGLMNNDIFARYSIKAQFARKIDSYFDMFGYKTNELKLPNLNNRPNWNYIKTVGCNISGDIPQDDLQAIKRMFDNGVTLWHNPLTFLDYSQNNR